MFEAILFDLDDTLLGNNTDSFIQYYFKLLGQYARQFMEPRQFLQEMLICTREMMVSTDTAVPNHDVFWRAFEGRTGLLATDLEPYFEQFYLHEFPKIAHVTERRPEAAELIQACVEQELKVVVATNPVFPRTAVLERMVWAGIPADAFPFELITTYENMHTTKPHAAYYQEILSRIECAPEQAVMVGDDWQNDIEPAAKLGIKTFWISNGRDLPPENMADGVGSLADFYQLLQDGWLEPEQAA